MQAAPARPGIIIRQFAGIVGCHKKGAEMALKLAVSENLQQVVGFGFTGSIPTGGVGPGLSAQSTRPQCGSDEYSQQFHVGSNCILFNGCKIGATGSSQSVTNVTVREKADLIMICVIKVTVKSIRRAASCKQRLYSQSLEKH
jgi:hypothetical protein